MVSAVKRKVTSFLGIDLVSLSYVGVGTLSLIYFLGLVRLNPDPHHDGVQFAAAVGVADGLKIQSQVFEQYGPVSAWIQGITLKVFGSTLLNLRIENALLLTLAGLLLLRIFFILNIPKSVSVLACLVWAVSCPVSSVYPGAFGFWPWSSVFALVLLLDNAAVLLRSQKRRKVLTDWELYLAGATCSVLIFTRFQVGIAAVFVNVALIAVGLGRSSSRDRFVRVAKYLTALGVGVGYFLAILAIQGSLASFSEQIIFGPIRQYVNPFDWQFAKIYYLFGSLPILISVLVTTLIWRKFSKKISFLFLALSTALLSFFMYIGNWNNNAYLNRFETWRAILDVQGIAFLFTSVVVFLVLGFLGLCFIFTHDFYYPLLSSESEVGRALRKIARVLGTSPKLVARYSTPIQASRRQRMAVMATLLFLELPFLVQLYPIADVYHLWWAVPLFTVLIPYLLTNFVSRDGVKAILLSILLPALVSSSIMFVGLLKVPRMEILSGALKGMQVEGQYIPSYFAVDAALKDLAPRSVRFFCRDGLISSWTGSYLQVDASYVNWAWVLKDQEVSELPSRIFVCGAKAYADSFAASLQLRVISAGIPFHLSYWSNDTLFELGK
jgi:hypothetical protein